MRVSSGQVCRVSGILALIGCSSAPASSDSIEGNVAQTEQPVIAGGTDVSFHVVGSDANEWENETASTQIRGTQGEGIYEYVAFNAEDPTHNSYVKSGVYEDRITCPQASLTAFSISLQGSGTRDRHPRPAPPVGWDLLWGDPAMAAWGQVVLLSTLASPADRFKTAVNDGACIRFSDVPGSRFPMGMEEANVLAGACIARGAPGNGMTIAENDCLRRGNDFFDGGSMATTGTSAYVAYYDVTTSKAAVYRSVHPSQNSAQSPFVALPDPPIFNVAGHPLLSSDFSDIYAAVPDAFGTVWYTQFSESSQSWSTPIVAGTGLNGSNVQLRNGHAIRAPVGMATAAISVPGNLLVGTVFQTGSSGNAALTGVLCATSPPSSCSPWFSLSLPSFNYFEPALFPYASQVAGTSRTAITYWTDADSRLAAGAIELQVAAFDPTGNGPTSLLTQGQFPCPTAHGGDFWGDYDTMWSRGSNSNGSVNLVRAITDSTYQTCDARDYRAFAQHVSIIPFTSF